MLLTAVVSQTIFGRVFQGKIPRKGKQGNVIMPTLVFYIIMINEIQKIRVSCESGLCCPFTGTNVQK
jgi:hypothetical protein